MTRETSIPTGGPGPDGSSPARGTTSRRRDQLGGEAEESWPRVPAERDESSDSQAGGVREVIRQGHDDLARGLQDTSRKQELERAYEMQKGQGAPGTAPAAGDRSGAGVHKTDAARGPGDVRSATADVKGGAGDSTIAAGDDADALRRKR